MNTRPLVVAPVLLAASLICAAAASAEDFWMLFQNQRVTISAKDVTVPKILDRWAQLGGTVVVNGDAVQGGPVTVQLVDVPEREALEILLRSVGGYIVAERTDAAEHASAIGRILILPTGPGQPRNVSAQASVAASFASERADVSGTEPTGFRVVPDAPFFPVAADAAPRAVSPTNAPVFMGGGVLPMRPADGRGSARPGEATAQTPELFRPTATPTDRPGAAPIQEQVTRQSPGPQPPPPE